MIYYLIRPFARLLLAVFFKHIHLEGVERIPRGKPVILAANHPSAFLEPCLLACFLDRGLHFLAKGSLFKNTFFSWFLSQVHIIPIYRQADSGFRALKQNFESFDACYGVLKANKTLMVLAEGNTAHEKRLRPLKKATARIAFGAWEAANLDDVLVVPTCVNYTYADQSRSEVMISFGEPISIQSYKQQYQEHPQRGMDAFLKDLHQELRKGVIHIENTDDEKLVEDLFLIDRAVREPAPLVPVVIQSGQAARREWLIAEKVNQLDADVEPTPETEITRHLNTLKTTIKQHGLRLQEARQVVNRGAIWMYLLWPLALLGNLLNYPHRAIPAHIAKTRVRKVPFKSSVAMALTLAMYLLSTLLCMLLGLLVSPWFYVGIGLVPFLGWIYLLHLAWRDDARVRAKQAKLPNGFLENWRREAGQLLGKL